MRSSVKKKGNPNHCKRVVTSHLSQLDPLECGAVCLVIVLRYFGADVPIQEVCLKTGVDRNASNALNIVKAAQSYGLQSVGYKKSAEELLNLPPPCILFWKGNHFVVLEGFYKKKAYINDPAFGRYRLSYKEFCLHYSGLAITFTKSEYFLSNTPKLSTLKPILPFLKRSGPAFFYLISTSILLTLPILIFSSILRLFLDNLHQFEQMQIKHTGIHLLLILTIGLLGFLFFLQQKCLGRLLLKISCSISYHFLWHILRLPLSYYVQRLSADTTYRIHLSQLIAEKIAGPLMNALIDICSALILAAFIINYNYVVGLIGLCFSIVILFVFLRSNRLNKGLRLQMQSFQDKSEHIGVHCIRHIESIKAVGAENKALNNIMGPIYTATMNQQKIGSRHIIMSALAYSFQTLIFIAVFVLGGYQVLQGRITLGVVVAIQFLMVAFLQPLFRFVNINDHIQNLFGYLARFSEVFRNPVDSLYNQAERTKHQDADLSKIQLTGHLNVENISFGYFPLGPPTIKDIQFTIEPGMRVAILGPTGSGKSTLAKLCSGLYTPWTGAILYDGKKISDFSRGLFTRSVSLVDQENLLFAASIRDNITMWDTTISEEDLLNACKDAGIHEEILRYPLGYEYKLTEGGKNLSGGQRQRIEIARALIKNPTFLILDEATSALDHPLEKKILENIRRRGCSCILITQHLNTVSDCDLILVLSHGSLIQKGTHETLSQNEGLYHSLAATEMRMYYEY